MEIEKTDPVLAYLHRAWQKSAVQENQYVRWAPLFAISSMSLFLELAVIRWISGEVRLMAYFKNLPLLAAFLGLAVGYALVGHRRNYQKAFPVLLGLLILMGLAIGRMGSSVPLAYPGAADEYFWYPGEYSDWIALVVFFGIILIFFFTITFLFIPLGQATGDEMARHRPVPAYMVNIAASLIGVWAFSMVSWLQTVPVIWFGLGILGIGAYLWARRKLSWVALPIFVVVLVSLSVSNLDTIWSPYQRLQVEELALVDEETAEPLQIGHLLNVQQVFFQIALNLDPEFVERARPAFPGLADVAMMYERPYKLVPEGSHVLIVGAGMGNDAAAAVRSNMGRIDAVEIDPAVADLGVQLHPEQPYSDPRVNVIVDDARAYINQSPDLYDLAVFGYLDSHTLLSSLSSVRLDSFVYTVQSLERVRDHLKPNGFLALSFADSVPWIEQRLGNMLIEVFGLEQVYVVRNSSPWGLQHQFVAGSVTQEHIDALDLIPWRPDPNMQVPLATDDWPYLYLRTAKVPAAYWQGIILIGFLGLAILARSFPETMKPNWHFWLLGAAFLLIEFKSITELALLFGTTWLVNALAISGVLVMILAANLYVLLRGRVQINRAYALLFASLVLTYFFPLESLAGLSPFLRALVSTSLLTLPLFFAGLIFAEALRRAGETARPLASNLSGTVVGGFLEYGSLMWGVKSLYIVGAILYVGAFIASRFQSD